MASSIWPSRPATSVAASIEVFETALVVRVAVAQCEGVETLAEVVVGRARCHSRGWTSAVGSRNG